MTLTPWKKLSEEVLAENPYWKYCKAVFATIDGKQHDYFYVQSRGAATIIGITDEGKIPLVNQYRPLVGRESLEFPMGGRDGQEPLVAARREFAEEAKMQARHFELVGTHIACNGILTEDQAVYVAWDLTQVESEQDETEEFEHFLMTPGEIDLAIAEGRIDDGMSISAWCQAKPRVLALIDQQKAKR